MRLQEIFNENHSIYETWRMCNECNSDKPAIEYFGHQFTFEQTDVMIDIYARAFMTMISDKTRSVTFCVPTLPSTLFAFYALNKIGIRANFVSDALLCYNASEYIDETDTEILVLLDIFIPAVTEAICKTRVKNVIVISLADNLDAIPDYLPDNLRVHLQRNNLAASLQEAIPSANIITLNNFVSIGELSTEDVIPVQSCGETAVVLYTGGSTGVPKGIEKTNEEFSVMSKLFAYDEMNFDTKAGDRNLILIPPNHPTGFVHCIVSWWNWGTVQVLQPFYDKNTFAHDLYNLKVQIAVAAPTLYATLPNCDLPDNALAHFRLPYCGGEAVTSELAASVNGALNRLGVQRPYLVIGYGMSEIGPATHCSIGVPGLGNKVGKPLPEVIARIVDEQGNVLGNNVRGHLEIKTPCRMKGYFKKKSWTDEFFTEDGFAKTGDIAVRDDDGYYDILGRSVDSITMQDGSLVYLFDIERVVYKNTDVLECEVVGLEVNGIFIPVVHIVLQPNCSSENGDIILRTHEICREYLPANEMPQGYKIREAFLTNPISTKRDYKALKANGEEWKGFYGVSGEGILVSRDFDSFNITEQIVSRGEVIACDKFGVKLSR